MKLKKHQSESLKKDLYPGLVVLAVATLLFGARLVATPLAVSMTVVSFVAFVVFMAAYLLQVNPAWLKVAHGMAEEKRKNILLFPVYLWATATLIGLITGQFTLTGTIVGLVYCLVPSAIMFANYQRPAILSWPDAVIILVLWLPIEFGWLPDINIPPIQSVLGLYKLVGLVLVIYLYFGVRHLPDVGLTFRLKGCDWRTAIQNFIFFMPIALIVGFATNFISLSERVPGFGALFAGFVGIALFIALPEEILFRGLIHNLLEKRLASRKNGKRTALILSSVLFGFAHGNNASPPFLDISLGSLGTWHMPWVYILLATIAGFFYGWTYIKTGKVTAAAVVHLLVDWFWSSFFSG